MIKKNYDNFLFDNFHPFNGFKYLDTSFYVVIRPKIK